MNDTSNIGANNTGIESNNGVLNQPIQDNTGVVTQNVETPIMPASEPALENPMVNINNTSVAPMTAAPVSDAAMVSQTPVQQTVVIGNPNAAQEVAVPVVPTVQTIAPVVQSEVSNPMPTVQVPQEQVANPITTPVDSNIQNQVVNQISVMQTPTEVVPAQPMPAITPVETNIAPVVPTINEESKVEIQMTDKATIDAQDAKEEKKKEKKEKVVKNNSDDDDDDEIIVNKTNKSPIVMVVIFALLLLVIFLYYFVAMTPESVFDSAIDDIFNNVDSIISGVTNSKSDRMKFDLGFNLDTEQSEFADSKEQEPIDYIDNDFIEGIINLDLRKQDIKVTLKSNKRTENFKKLGITNRVKIDESKDTQEMLDFSIYSVDDKMYIGPIDYINYNDIDNFGTERIVVDKKIQVDLFETILKAENEFSFNFDRISSILKVMSITANRVTSDIDNSELKRTIAFKKVGDTTAIALKVTSDVNHKRIVELYQKILGDYYQNKGEVYVNSDGVKEDINIIQTLATATGYSEEYIKNWLFYLINEREVATQNVKVDLYMNLANTKLISLNVNIDDKYIFSLDHLNGYYSFHIEIIENVGQEDQHDLFLIDASYNINDGIVDGLGILDNDNTYLAVKFDYNREETTSGKKTGNNLILRFYKNKTYENEDESQRKPFAKLDCKLEIFDSQTDLTDSTKFDIESEVKDAWAIPYSINLQGVPKSSVENLNEITLTEAINLLKFENNFISHIQFLVDHLLYNKEGALTRKKNAANETTSTTPAVEETITTTTDGSNSTQTTTTETTETTETKTETAENN